MWGEDLVDVAVAELDDPHLRALAAPALGAQIGGGAGVQGDGKRLEVEGDQFGGVLGDVRVLGQHHRDGFADVADEPGRQRRLQVGGEVDAGVRLADRDAQPAGQVRGGVDADDALQRGGGGRVDAQDAGVGEGRAHDAHPQLVGEDHIVVEPAAPAQQALVLQPGHGLPDGAHCCTCPPQATDSIASMIPE
jgi:hypothetical protein